MKAYDADGIPYYEGDVVWFKNDYWTVVSIDEFQETVLLDNGHTETEVYEEEVYVKKRL